MNLKKLGSLIFVILNIGVFNFFGHCKIWVIVVFSFKNYETQFFRFVLALAAICLATPIFFPTDVAVIFGSFVVFEVCVGIFWPAMGYLRGKYIPEHARSTTMNFFRIPLNLIVILILWQNFPMTVIFQFCVAFLIIAAFVQHAMCG